MSLGIAILFYVLFVLMAGLCLFGILKSQSNHSETFLWFLIGTCLFVSFVVARDTGYKAGQVNYIKGVITYKADTTITINKGDTIITIDYISVNESKND